MVESTRPPKNGFVAAARRVYNPIGFSKGYNFVLWFIFDGALLGFTLSRLPYLDFAGVYCSTDQGSMLHAAPGECYWYQNLPRNKIGIITHLATILPAALLAAFQFVPAIRRRALLYHRIAGHVILLLTVVSNGSALAISNHAFGGDASTRTMIAALVVATTASLGLATYNIKRLQIDQHRAWMLRAWFYFGSIVTMRLLMVVAGAITAGWEDATMRVSMPCAEVLFVFDGKPDTAYELYPACMPGTGAVPAIHVPVAASFASPTDPAGTVAALDAWFGSMGWLAFFVHLVAVEVYLHLTPRESQRLRQVSCERQLERGFKNAGRAGLVHDRIGDSDPWVPTVEVKRVQSSEDESPTPAGGYGSTNF